MELCAVPSGRWRAKSKTGPRAVPLSPPAAKVLAELPRVPGNLWAILGQKPDTPMTDLDDPWRILRERAGIEKARIHDCRHSWASRALALSERPRFFASRVVLARVAGAEASVAVHAGRDIERLKSGSSERRDGQVRRRQHRLHRKMARCRGASRRLRPHARMNALHRDLGGLHSAPAVEPVPQKEGEPKPEMNGVKKSDGAIVCAGQHPDRVGWSPTGTQVGGAISKSLNRTVP